MYQVLCTRARALKNGGNDAIVYAKRHLRCVLRTGGDRAAQGDVPVRLAWVLGTCDSGGPSAHTERQITPGSLCCKGCSMAQTASEPGS